MPWSTIYLIAEDSGLVAQDEALIVRTYSGDERHAATRMLVISVGCNFSAQFDLSTIFRIITFYCMNSQMKKVLRVIFAGYFIYIVLTFSAYAVHECIRIRSERKIVTVQNPPNTPLKAFISPSIKPSSNPQPNIGTVDHATPKNIQYGDMSLRG
jgi:hypothetical protein